MIVTNVLVFTNDPREPFLEDALVRFENGEITYAGSKREYSIQEEEETIDGEKGLLLPAFFNAHLSIYSSILAYPFKLVEDYATGVDYFSGLLKVAQADIGERLVKLSAEVAVLKALKCGAVSISGPVFDCPDVEPKFYRELAHKYGVNLAIGPVVVKDSMSAIIERWQELERDDNFQPLIYVSELATYSEEELTMLKSLHSGDLKLNLFIFDMKQENELCLSKWGENLIERLLKNGLLIPECGIIYGGNLSETDMDIISSRKIFVIKSIRSEMYAGSFQPNIADLLGRGMHVSLGTGFVGYDLLEEAKEVALSERCHRHYGNDVIDYEIRKTLLDNNYRLAQRFFGKRAGMIKEGYSADLILSKSYLNFERLDPTLPAVIQLVLKGSSECNYDKVWNSGELLLDRELPKRISRREYKELAREIKNLEL